MNIRFQNGGPPSSGIRPSRSRAPLKNVSQLERSEPLRLMSTSNFSRRRRDDHLPIFAQRGVAWITHIAPDAVDPRHAIHERGDVGGNGDVQFRLRIRLPHHPQRRQQMHRVAEKAEVEHHDFPGIPGAVVEIVGT